MGRNKKKSKAAAHAASSESDEEHEEERDAPTVAPAGEADGTAAAASAEGVPRNGHDSGSESDDEDGPKKKKKEYKGNRLKKQEGKGKKGKGNKGAAHEAEKAAEAAGSEDGDNSDEDDGRPVHHKPIQVLYCPHCTFPAEMCEFGGMMDKCRPWLLEHAAELADAQDRGRKRRILTEKERLEALLEGRGIKKALERIVLLEVEKRTGRRMITSVFGMDLFGHNLKDVSRDWRKRFSCGAGVRSAEEGKHQDCIDIQGNVADQLAEMLVAKYNIPKESVYIMEGKKKVPYPY